MSVLAVAVAALFVVAGAAGVPGDPTPPVVKLVIDSGKLGADGWYTTNLTFHWDVTDPESIILQTIGCGYQTVVTDTAAFRTSCYAKSDGGETTQGHTFKLDKTPPAVSAAPTRAADANGWYNHPVSVWFSGTDAMSGMGACSSAGYAGPDNPSAAVSGNCRDNAGNLGGAVFWFKYDATPPSVSSISAKNRNRKIDLKWKASTDTQLVEVARAPGLRGAGVSVVYQGPASSYRDTGLKVGERYHYSVTAIDPANNRAAKSLAVTATGALLNPLPGATISRAPLLAWAPKKGASYYNLQLMRGGKILSVWVTRPRFQLRRSWVFNGRRYRLHRGVYRWYVWPGFGLFSAGRYGRLLGGSSFVYTG